MTCALACCGLFSHAHAQSSVTLYGVIDTGIDFASNVDGQHLWQMASGVSAGSRWGLRGKEDLGGGLAAIFDLESGFNSTNGGLGSGTMPPDLVTGKDAEDVAAFVSGEEPAGN